MFMPINANKPARPKFIFHFQPPQGVFTCPMGEILCTITNPGSTAKVHTRRLPPRLCLRRLAANPPRPCRQVNTTLTRRFFIAAIKLAC
ncbi:hypothetical protein BIY27_03770 [Gibbsiella quercinecans]|nr:hypothetical protein BIY27_03770 [Gibbsiella quercinecans]